MTIHGDSSLEWNESALESSLAERFEGVACIYADSDAITDATATVSYAQLQRESGRLANAILKRGGDGIEPIVVMAGHTVGAVVGVLGALRAGKFYSVLNPDLPEKWLAATLQDLNPALVLCTAEQQALAERLAGKERILRLAGDENEPSSGHIPRRTIAADDPAVVYYSSGTTGEPKGILINQRSLLQRGWSAVQRGQARAGSRLLGSQSLMYGLSISSLYGTLLNGAAVILRNASRLSALELLRLIESERVTSLTMAPSLLRSLLSCLEENNFRLDIEYLGLSGERLYPADVRRLRERLPAQAVVEYRMAATETVGAFRSLLLADYDASQADFLPVGYPTPGYQTLILDGEGQPAQPGESGEIAVRSRYLAMGYWNKPELNARRFLPDPQGGDQRIFLTGDLGRLRPDGSLEFLGRMDQMVKVRGYRVEPGSVEAALRRLEWFKDVVVGTQPLPAGDQQLIAYLVPKAWPAPTVSKLRQALKDDLPDYLIPNAYVFLEALPHLPNGKVNRRALPQPDIRRPELDTAYTPPRTPVEQILADIWQEALRLAQVGVEDHFFELGGDSLAATQVIARIRSRLGIELSIQRLFEKPTVAGLSQEIEMLYKQHNDPKVWEQGEI